MRRAHPTIRRLRHCTGVVVASGFAVSAILALASTAHAGWLPPVDISQVGEHAGAPQVVLDASGNATAVWERWVGSDIAVETAYRPAGGNWQPPVDISEEGSGTVTAGEHNAYSPSLAVDAAGDTTVVWARSAGTNKILVQAVYRPAGGAWQTPVDLGEMNSAIDPEPWVAADEAGDTTAIWKSNEVVESAYRPASGSWEPSVALSAGESYAPQAAMDARGDAMVAWMHYDGSRYVDEAVYRAVGHDWGARLVISEEGEGSGDPEIALSPAGDAIAVWKGHSSGGEAVRAAYRPAGQEWQLPTNVSKVGIQAESLHVALDGHGDALLAWGGTHGAGGYELAQASYRPAGGEWEEPMELSQEGQNAFPSDLVFDKRGNAAVVWERSNGSDNIAQADYMPAGGSWQPPSDVSEDGAEASDAVLVLDAPGSATAADGDATIVWTSSEGGCAPLLECPEPATYRIQAAGYDSIDPTEPLEAPTLAEVGKPVAFSAPTLDVWSPLLSFGDGDKAAATSATHTYSAPGEYTVSFSNTEVLGYPRRMQRTILIEPSSKPLVAKESPVAKEEKSESSPPAQLGSVGKHSTLRASIRPLEQSLGAIRKTRELRFVCQMSEPGRCYVHTRLGSASITLKHAGHAVVKIRVSSKRLLGLRHLHVLRVKFMAIAMGRGRLVDAGELIAR
ncbi:MAG: PKD domain-containing protein [Solirubrobacteraceae bacterium]